MLQALRRFAAALSAVLLILIGLPAPAAAQPVNGVTCERPESDAEALEILGSGQGDAYWWDHTNLTVVVLSQPGADDAYVTAIHDAIAAWDEVLRDCFDGLITLTDITGTKGARSRADIVIRYVLHAGGVSRGAFALCVKERCTNVLLSSVAPPGSNFEDTPLQDFEWLVMHELGHTLGLGHPTNIDSIDLMGYGWIGENQPPPILSDCDVDALAFIWAWALDGTSPSPPTSGLYDCSQS